MTRERLSDEEFEARRTDVQIVPSEYGDEWLAMTRETGSPVGFGDTPEAAVNDWSRKYFDGGDSGGSE